MTPTPEAQPNDALCKTCNGRGWFSKSVNCPTCAEAQKPSLREATIARLCKELIAALSVEQKPGGSNPEWFDVEPDQEGAHRVIDSEGALIEGGFPTNAAAWEWIKTRRPAYTPTPREAALEAALREAHSLIPYEKFIVPDDLFARIDALLAGRET